MATKEEFTKEVTQLPGVGKATADKLWEAGYKTLADLKGIDTDKLKDAGVTGKSADAVLAGLQDLEGAAPAEIEVREKGKKAAPKEEKVEVVERKYEAKAKPELDDATKAALLVREDRARREPAFRRYHWWYGAGRLDDAWRRPRGYLNKQRRGWGRRPPAVNVGYGKPALTRGLHPSGFEEILVHNVQDLGRIDPKTQAARVGGTVGGRKQKAIETAAAEKGIRILNPRRT